MKAMGSALKRRIARITGMAASALLMGGVTPAFARPLDEAEITGPIPAAPVQAVSGGSNAWLIGLIVAVGVLALTAALIGTVRLYRSRTHTVAAGA